MSLPFTTSQTIGPFPHEAWRWAFDAGLAEPALTISGTVYDGSGAPVSDALIEAWLPGTQAAAIDGLPGFHRVPSSDDGSFRLALPARAAPGQPAAYITVFARGVLKHQFCAVFLGDDAGLADAPLLAQVPAERRATLIGERIADGHYRWDIHLQGSAETVFFDFE